MYSQVSIHPRSIVLGVSQTVLWGLTENWDPFSELKKQSVEGPVYRDLLQMVKKLDVRIHWVEPLLLNLKTLIQRVEKSISVLRNLRRFYIYE